MNRIKYPKVQERKLMRENARGLYCDGVIEIDPRLGSREYLIVLVHEYLHHIYPWMTEDQVDESGELIGGFLWKNNYRKVQLK